MNSELRRWESALGGYNADLERLKGRLTRLQNKVEDKERTAVIDNIATVANAAGVIASIFPAIRAVQTGIRVYCAASGVARAVAAGDSLTSAVAAVSLVSVFGLDFLKPSTKRQLQEAQAELEEITRQTRRVGGIIQELVLRADRKGCNFVDT